MSSLMTPIRSEQQYVISYLTLRKAVGFIGMALPIVLILVFSLVKTDCVLPPSISHYYYTFLGSYFTGTMCAVALFLFAYNGPARADRIAATVAAVCSLGLVFFPTNSFIDYDGVCCQVGLDPNNIRNAIHVAFAGVLYMTFAFFCLFLFTRTYPGQKATGRKKQRNVVYVICGILLLVTVVLMILFAVWPIAEGFRLRIYVVETVGLLAFGVSWLIKGQFVLKD